MPKEKIMRFQKLFLNIWPPRHYFFLNGWILTFTGGLTGRSNSVLTIDYTGENLEEDITTVETAYKIQNLPVRFKLADYFNPPELTDILLERGYRYSNYSLITVGCKVREIKAPTDDEFSYEFTEQRTSEFSDFLTKFSSSLTEDQHIMTEITRRIFIPKKCFILAKLGKIIIGSIMVVLDPQGYMYIAELFVHPDYRRRKIGTSLVVNAMEWGKSHNGSICWLHVERDNEKAVELYEKMGFQKWYGYRYMIKD
ncbi:MAG: GNAT family N-acetyltransferase [Candidatus Hodarchaeales archaeon]|jgi:ribosomal protein S18 acetylase RimI-like enzyme